MNHQTIPIFIYIWAFFLGATGAWLMAKYGRKLGLIDRPNERSSHQNATPKGGGVGILAGFVMASLTVDISLGLWIPAVLIALLSLINDYLPLSPRLRIIFQFGCSMVFLLSLPIIGLDQPTVYWLIIPLSIFMVGTANFYNFMDGINGIAGITGLVGFGLLAYCSFAWGTEPALFVVNIAIALGCLGFLPFNFPKAKVFMGDVGSIFLGFLFAAAVVLLSDNVLDFVCLGALLFPFYMDELTTMLLRIKERERLSKPHRKHLYQILANEYEIAHWKVSSGFGLFQLVIGFSVLAIKSKGILPVLILLILYGCIFSAFSLLLRQRLALKTISH
jgi:Fuc2NAc and GlcNAc transferase